MSHPPSPGGSSTKAVTAANQQPAAAPVHPYVVVALVMLGNCLGPLYSSTANVVIPNLVAAFGSDVDTMEWAITGYMLGYSISMPVAGWLADTFGRRRIYLLGLALFTASSVLVAFAFDPFSLIGFRILQAIGGGLISPTGMALVTDVIPEKQRGAALGLWGMGMMLAPAFGPWLSGTIIDVFDDWRLVFLLGLPIGIAALVLSYRYLPADRPRLTRRARFDVAGFSALTTALAAFLIPRSQGNRVGWDDLAHRRLVRPLGLRARGVHCDRASARPRRCSISRSSAGAPSQRRPFCA